MRVGEDCARFRIMWTELEQECIATSMCWGRAHLAGVQTILFFPPACRKSIPATARGKGADGLAVADSMGEVGGNAGGRIDSAVGAGPAHLRDVPIVNGRRFQSNDGLKMMDILLKRRLFIRGRGICFITM
jgi:hypothetical protein